MQQKAGKSGWVNQVVTIQTTNGPVNIEGLVRDGLAVHLVLSLGGQWSIVHLRSGLSVALTATRHSALRLAECLLHLARRDGWSWADCDEDEVLQCLARSLYCSVRRLKNVLDEASLNPTDFAKRYVHGRSASTARVRTYRWGHVSVTLRTSTKGWITAHARSGRTKQTVYIRGTARAAMRALKATWRCKPWLRWIYDHDGDVYTAYHRGQLIVTLPGNLSARRLRAAALMAVVEMRRRKPRPMKDPATGELMGWRLLQVGPRGRLHSPFQGTWWATPELHAHRWDESEVVRGVAGIHAWWPAPDGGPPHAALQEWKLGPYVLAEVRGFGRYVAGTDGWRAEKARVVRLLVLPSQLEAIAVTTQNRRWRSVELQLISPLRSVVHRT